MPPDETPLRRLLAGVCTSPSAVAAAVLLSLILIAALAAPLIAPQSAYDPAQLSGEDGRLPPGTTARSGETFWLGSDDQGRDILSAIVYGLRTSLTVAALSTLGALALGLTMGLGAAYFGGRIETLIMGLAEVQLSVPALLIAAILLAVLGQGMGKMIAALTMVQWACYARSLRGAVRVEQGKAYIEAARGLALPPSRVVFGHLLPNCLPPVVVVIIVQLAAVIALEATLSFLGLGVPSTEPSLGLLIAKGYPCLLEGKYWISLFPGVALLLMIVAMNVVADQLGDALEPRQR